MFKHLTAALCLAVSTSFFTTTSTAQHAMDCSSDPYACIKYTPLSEAEARASIGYPRTEATREVAAREKHTIGTHGVRRSTSSTQ